jgi:hypothetical protein
VENKKGGETRWITVSIKGVTIVLTPPWSSPPVSLRTTDVIRTVAPIPQVRFDPDENCILTSFGGLVIYQTLFERLGLQQKIEACFLHFPTKRLYSPHIIVLGLIAQILIGFRCLRDRDYYADDPLVCGMLGVRRLPDVSTISRTLAEMDEVAVEHLRGLSKNLVLDRVEQEQLPRVTLDFDGSVISTTRHAEGTAVGFNKKKKGARSYYHLFCTVAQTGQFLDRLHRPGNVHDSNGAVDFSRQCFETVRERLPQAVLEARIDSAFFNENYLSELNQQGVEFTASVPFARFPKLKTQIESRKRWCPMDETWSYFEVDWKPDCWTQKFRMIVLRQKKKQPTKGPLQLDLFEPLCHEYDYSMIVTNKRTGISHVLDYHHGRGTQEGIFAEGKSQCQLDYIPVRKKCGNQTYCLAAMLAHNLTRELQMQAEPRPLTTTAKRRPLWVFESLKTIRHRLLRRAGRLVRPQGCYTLSLSANEVVEQDFEKYLSAGQAA